MAESLPNTDIPNRSDMIELLKEKITSIYASRNAMADLHKFILSVTKEKSETQQYAGLVEFHVIIFAIIHIVEKLVSIRPLSIDILVDKFYPGGELLQKDVLEKQKVLFDILLGDYPIKLAHTIILEKLNEKHEGQADLFKSKEFLAMMGSELAEIMKQDQFRMAGQLQIAKAVLMKLA